MKRIITVAVLAITLSGCATVDTVKKYWPRNHDPIMFDHLVTVSIAVEMIDCGHPDWSQVVEVTHHLSRYAEWRGDPQADNLKGLLNHDGARIYGGNQTPPIKNTNQFSG